MDKLIFTIAASLGLISILSTLSGAMPGSVPPPKPTKADMQVGVYYFPGWSRVDRWYCMAADPDVQHPLLGYYREGDPEAADWQIKWAKEHGISFFAFDFYTEGGSQMLETALDDGFLKSKYIGQFKFCLNWCNHSPESVMTADELEKFGDVVIKKYLTHPSYLKIDGKPVIIMLVGHAFIRNMGVDAAKKAFDRLEERCKEAGLPGVYLVFCHDAMGPNEIENSRKVGVDAFTRYNYPYAGTGITQPGKHAEFSYQHLTQQAEAMWKEWRKLTNGDYWPTVMPGWDRRPWTKFDDVIITGSTPELFAESLAKARDYVNKDRIVMIEAWNEWGEGSVIEPSVEKGFGYLDAVRKVFCPDAGPHQDIDLKLSGAKLPVFDLKLPAIDAWRFDFDNDGWTVNSVTELGNKWGMLMGTSANGDPQLMSPITYLDCARYRTVHIRMKASRPANGQLKATGQLFWSTVDQNMNEALSAKFEVPLDGEWHEYNLDLKANPNWKGITDRFRLDPVDVEGVGIAVDEVSLIRG